MGLMDRDWFRDESRRREGLPPRDNGGGNKGTKRPHKTRWSTSAEDVAKANNIPPAHTILAARYELALRARTKKTFTIGFACGIAAVAVTLALIYL